MAVPSYTEDLTDITLSEATTGFVAYGGGGAGLSASPDLSMQGTNCVDKQITNADKGLMFDNGAGITLGAGDHVWIWHFAATPGLTDTRALKGASVLIGSATGAYCQYHVEGNDTYGAGGRVARCYPIDYALRTANAAEPYRTLTGTPAANPQVFGGGLNTTASVKGANVGIDAMRYGLGGFLTAGELISAGDASDDPCNFADFSIDSDNVTNRWGILTASGAGFELQGTFAIGRNNAGTATLARFEVSDVSISFADTIHAASDFSQIIIDHASTVCNWTNVSLTALGTTNKGRVIVDANDPTFNLTTGTFTGIGPSTFQASTTIIGTTFRGTELVTQNGADITDILVEASAVTPALLSDTPNLITDSTFVSAGTGHAIEIDTAGTYTFDNNTFTGYSGTGTDAAIHFNPAGGTGNLVLNVINGGNIAEAIIRNSSAGTVTVNNSVTITLTGLIAGSRVFIENTTDSIVLFNQIEATTTFSQTVNYTADKALQVRVRNSTTPPPYYVTYETTGTLTDQGFSVTVNQILDE